jgi:hypothetical protein
MAMVCFSFLGVVSFVLFCFSAVTGKDGNPMGVVRRGGAHKTCSVKAHLIVIEYYLSPQTYLSTSVNRRCDQHPETHRYHARREEHRDETTQGVTDTAKTTIPHRV